MLYRLQDIFFAFYDFEFMSGKLERSSNPNDRATASTLDRGIPVTGFRDPQTITHVFTLEVDYGSKDSDKLEELAYEQFYSNKPINQLMKRLVFNDGRKLKIISNNAFFAEEPNFPFATYSEKVTFTIHAVDARVEFKKGV